MQHLITASLTLALYLITVNSSLNNSEQATDSCWVALSMTLNIDVL